MKTGARGLPEIEGEFVPLKSGEDLEFMVVTASVLPYDRVKHGHMPYDPAALQSCRPIVAPCRTPCDTYAGFNVLVTGRTTNGASVSLIIRNYMKRLVLEWDDDATDADFAHLEKHLRAELEKSVRKKFSSGRLLQQNVFLRRTRLQRLWYWRPSREDPRKPHMQTVVEVYLGSFWTLRDLMADLQKTEYIIPSSARKMRLHFYEESWNFVSQFLTLSKVGAMKWMRVACKDLTTPAVYLTHSQVEFEVVLNGMDRVDLPEAKLGPFVTEKVAPLVIMSFDAEVLGRTGFPRHGVLEDEVFLICCSVMVVGKPGIAHRKCFTSRYFSENPAEFEAALLRIRERNPNATLYKIELFDEVFVGDGALEMLAAWRNYVVFEAKPDVLTGYNLGGFDCESMHESFLANLAAAGPKLDPRSALRNFPYFSVLIDEEVPLKKTQHDSCANGENDRNMWVATGRIVWDLYDWVKANKKNLRKYNMDAVMQGSLGVGKVECNVKDMVRHRDQQDLEGLLDDAIYCQFDADLPLWYIQKNQVILGAIMMGVSTNTLLTDVLLGGTQIKSYNLMQWFAHVSPDFLMYNNNPADIGGFLHVFSYEGATVLEPLSGYYVKPIATLDFGSLYPNIIIGHAICFSTLLDLESPPPPIEEIERRYGLKREELERAEGQQGRVNYFVRPCIRKGLFPHVMDYLLQKRKEVKKLMKAEQDPFGKAVYDALQLAVKLAANGGYGLTGAGKGFMVENRLAESVTKFGRDALEKTKAAVEALGEGRLVVYGDSVPGHTPIIIRCHSLAPIIVPISALCSRYLLGADDKQRGVDFEHPLLTKYLAQVPPAMRGELYVRAACDVDVERSCTGKVGRSGFLAAQFTKIQQVVRHRTSKKLYRITTMLGEVTVTEDHSLCVVQPDVHLAGEFVEMRPCDVSIGMLLLHAAPVCWPLHPLQNDICTTLEALAPQDAGDDACRVIRDVKAATAASQCWLEGQAAVFDSSGTWVPRKIADITADYDRFTSILDIRDVTAEYPGEALVYDLTTASHVFQAGVGSIVVHNTDSVFVRYDGCGGDEVPRQEVVDAAMKKAQHDVDHINALFEAAGYKSLKLELEKVMLPLMLGEEKKHYAGKKFEVDKPPALLIKGMSIVKKDTTEYVKKTMTNVMEQMIMREDLPGAVEVFRGALQQMVDKKVPPAELVQSKSLKREYKAENVVQHQVNKKRQKRNPGSEHRPGDRVEFIILNGKKLASVTDRAEDAEYAIPEIEAGRLLPDRNYYLENQLQNSATKFFGIAKVDVLPMIQSAMSMITTQDQGLQDLSSFFTRRKVTPPNVLAANDDGGALEVPPPGTLAPGDKSEKLEKFDKVVGPSRKLPPLVKKAAALPTGRNKLPLNAIIGKGSLDFMLRKKTAEPKVEPQSPAAGIPATLDAMPADDNHDGSDSEVPPSQEILDSDNEVWE